MRFLQIISLCVAALLGAGMVDARPHLYDHLERSDISLASAYINNLPADETITKRTAATTEENDAELHHRIDVTNREYLEIRTEAQVQQKRQSHYKFRIGNGQPIRRRLEMRKADPEGEEMLLPTAALPI
ncbi:hypothetical protein TMatcc_008433 [Talaromyces marneffei ATCC 18224]|uniref:Uncharacterized protein n=2 Tax=Talaromyces marneffei TaxID=37727 RepID=B6QM11_TALMQ|nr:uncharacterized protein EYB26_007772 [Talaromyces marneffei]EEA22138.1 hypothetical protein PMAA_059180 [Talaromyces marneffei ATCC 18224]KAE8550406.1 hypothetical protein EYB25_006632 [Talaromyces marneffei]QGA20072.1 hypothetical protein EYB26_007772 [Talaromyces marneffei]